MNDASQTSLKSKLPDLIPYSNWVPFVAIVRKEIKRFMRIWPQTLVPPAITIVLYFMIFGQLIGSRIGQMGGYDYIQFIVPGLIMMAVINNSYSNVVSSFFGTKFQKSIEELLSSPVPNYVILLGYISGGMVRGLLVGLIVTGFSLFFTKLHVAHLGLTLLTVLMTAFVFSLAGFINAVYANTFDDISVIPTFVLTPLIYLGGVFYSVDLLSDTWQSISLLNPILYMVNAFRFGILGVSDIDISSTLAILAVFSIGLFTYSMWLLKTGKGLRS